MLEGEREKLLQMEGVLSTSVIGQEEAITAISNAVRRARAGLQDPNRPSSSFLFLGPTGANRHPKPRKNPHRAATTAAFSIKIQW